MADPDNLLKYCTPKYVYIRDAKLGIMKYSLMLLIFFYVVVYNILYTCDHLDPHHAQGFGTIRIQHPVDDCHELDADCLAEWDNIATLPYCDQYLEPSKRERRLSEDEEQAEKKGHADAQIGDTITKPKTCRYLDNRRLVWETGVPSEIFIPTHYTQIKQKINKECYNPDFPKEDDEKFRCKSGWLTEEYNEFYVADIERFKVILEHSFHSPNIGKFGVSTDFQGLFAACTSNHPTNMEKDCKRAKVPGSTGKIAPEDEEGLFTAEELEIPSLKASKNGEDEITLGDFLKVTPVAQEHDSVRKNVLDSKLPASLGHKGDSLRDVGGMLLLDVDYANTGYSRPAIPGMPEAYQVKPITYTYRPYFIPTRENKHFQYISQSDVAEHRIIDIWYGVTIKMQFNGQLVEFTWPKLLKGLTTGMVLLASATTLVCLAASYVLPLSEKYNAMMFQMSEDMSDFKELRDSRSGCIETWINPLGLLESDKWMKEKAVYPSGQLLLDSLDDKGEVKKDLSPEDITKILCIEEMRLAHLDGMDTRMNFVESTDDNRVNKNIEATKKKFYKDKADAKP